MLVKWKAHLDFAQMEFPNGLRKVSNDLQNAFYRTSKSVFPAKQFVVTMGLTHEFLERSKAFTFLVFLKVYKGFVSCYQMISGSA